MNNWVCCFQTTTIKTYPETNQSNQNRSWQQVEYKLTNTLYAPPDRSAPHPSNVKIINFPHRNERIRSVAHQYFFGECNKTATIKQGDRKIHFHSVAFETPSKRRRRSRVRCTQKSRQSTYFVRGKGLLWLETWFLYAPIMFRVHWTRTQEGRQ